MRQSAHNDLCPAHDTGSTGAVPQTWLACLSPNELIIRDVMFWQAGMKHGIGRHISLAADLADDISHIFNSVSQD